MTLTDRQRLGDLKAAVQHLLRRNRQQGHATWCDRDYDFVCPSVETYPFQWFWDSCFHAIVLSRLDPTRAAAELRTLLANQHSDGFISHVTLWQRDADPAVAADYQLAWRSPWLSDAMQPPVLADALAAVVHRGVGTAVLRELLPGVRAYYEWCHRVRDTDGDGLIVVFDPHETGMDQTPAFDEYLRVRDFSAAGFATAWRDLAGAHAAVGRDPERMLRLDRFVVADVLVNALYADNQRILGDVLREAGDAAGAAELHARAARTAAALVERCWDNSDGEFLALAGRAGRPMSGGTVAGLVPLLLADLPEAIVARTADRLVDQAEFAARFPVPSVARSHPAFSATPIDDVLFRGPTWINTNWLIARGLRRHGREAMATTIEDASLALVERSGFREYYNPDTGAGYGARGFAWSALALEMFAGRVEGDALA